MTILDTIVAHKQTEVATNKLAMPIVKLEESPLFQMPRTSLVTSIGRKGSSGVIAEIKRKSPSKGEINPGIQVEKVAKAYEAAGVAGISVLTDFNFFGGSSQDLMKVRDAVSIPILRKDFIIDAYQIYEARAMGADVILLIAACLGSEEIREFTALAHELELEVLMEVHNEEELLTNRDCGADLIGVNNRDLKTFKVSIQTSIDLLPQIPENAIKVAESGLSKVEEVEKLRSLGFQGFLMGQRFMEKAEPGKACQDFIKSMKAIRN